MGAPKPRQTYLEEIEMERRLLRSLNTEINTRPITWGLLGEKLVFNLLGLEYKYYSDETKAHPTIPGWAGSPDGEKPDCIIDIKCPYTLKSFCELVEICNKQDIEFFKSEHPDYYWQLVSNAIITDKKNAELIVFCPYLETLPTIIHMAQNIEQDQFKYYWVAQANYDELPYILKESEYSEINKFEFEVPESDKQLLTNTIQNLWQK